MDKNIRRRLGHKFAGMHSRCYNSADRHYYSYGGRGITICRIWRHAPRKFIAWAISTGWQPKLELDRIDPLGPYAPWNCRWLTHEEHLEQTAKTNRMQGSLLVYRTPKRHRKYKLSRDDVLYIHAHPEKRSVELAEELGVRRSTIWNVRCGGTWTEYHPQLHQVVQKRDWKCRKRVSWSGRDEVREANIRKAAERQKEFVRQEVSLQRRIDFIYEHSDWCSRDLEKATGFSIATIKDIYGGCSYKRFWRGGKPPVRKGFAAKRVYGLSDELIEMIYLSRNLLTRQACADIVGVSRRVIVDICIRRTHCSVTDVLQDIPPYTILPPPLRSRGLFLLWAKPVDSFLSL